LNIKIAAASTTGVTRTSSRLSHNHRQYGRASGQNRRYISRKPAVGATSTKSPTPSTGVGRNSDLITSRTGTPPSQLSWA
jgi:hypothetical protein